MKKQLIQLTCIALLSSCSVSMGEVSSIRELSSLESISSETLYDYTDDLILDDNVLFSNAEAEWIFDVSDPLQLKDHSTNIFLAYVISKDKALNYFEDLGYIFMPYTIGTMRVCENYYGEIPQSITYYRQGGIMTFADYLEYAPQERKDKFNSLDPHPDYISDTWADDITLETGRYYLVYARYDDISQRYYVCYSQYGTREVIDSFLLDNNGKSMPLSDYLDQYVLEH